MINLTVYPARTFFEGKRSEIKKQLLPLLRIEDKNSYWRERFVLKRMAYFKGYSSEVRERKIEKLKESVRYTKFYNLRSHSFLSGLVPRVIKRLKKNEVSFSVDDQRKGRPEFERVKKLRFQDVVEVREEQVEMVNTALEKGIGILHAATNFGKTEVASAICSEFSKQQQRQPRVLFIVHRVGLAQQTAERFKKHLGDRIAVRVTGGGEKKVPKGGILVTTVQTAVNMLEDGGSSFIDFIEKCDILFIDEFHVNKAWACSRVAERCSATMRFGLSGTIDKKNKTKMFHYMGMCGPIIAEMRNKDLVNLGRSARPQVRFVEVNAPEVSKKLKFAGGYSLGVVKNEIRNKLVVKEILRHLEKDRKTLVTVARIQHGKIIQQMLERKIDLKIEFLSGSTPQEVRVQKIKEFERGKIAVLIASPIFDTGIDVPAIEAWVNAASGKGWELTLQRLGRVLRKKEGDNRVFISDFVDKHNFYLFKHSMARISHYMKEEVVKMKIIGASK